MKNLSIKLLIFIGFLFLGNNLKADTTYVDLDTIADYQKLGFCNEDTIKIFDTQHTDHEDWYYDGDSYEDYDSIIITINSIIYSEDGGDSFTTKNINTSGDWKLDISAGPGELLHFSIFFNSLLIEPWNQDSKSICYNKDTLYAGPETGENYQDGLRYIWTKIGSIDTIADAYYPNDTSLIVSENGDYILKIIGGCNTVTDTIHMELTTSNPPNLGSDKHFCNEDVSCTLSTTESYDSYLWSDGSTEPSLYTESPGIYYVTVGNACIDNAVDSITIYKHTYPQIDLGDDISICEGTSVTLTTFDYTKEGWERWYNLNHDEELGDSCTITINSEMQIRVEIKINGCPEMEDLISIHVLHPPSSINLCMVTVDTATHKNLIVWEKPNNSHIDKFVIYKEKNTDEYFPIGEVAYSDLSQYIDTSSSPDVHADKYKIAVMDTCGNTSDLSPYHQTMNLSKAQGSEDNEIILLWNKYEDESGDFVPTNYKIYRKELGESWYLEDSVSGGLSSYNYNVKNVKEGEHFIVAIDMPTCTPTRASGGPYYQSTSNLEDDGIVGPSNIYNSNIDDAIAIYPNPTSGKFQIKTKLDIKQVELVNIIGQTVLLSNSETIDLKHQTKGIYFVKIITARGLFIKKLVLK